MKTTLTKTIFFVEESQSGPTGREYKITQTADVKSQIEIIDALKVFYQNNNSHFAITVVTDTFECKEKDQVIPLQPEQIFFMNYTDLNDIKDADILEIGIGSGILSIFCFLKGATHCTSLDISPRARLFCGYNTLLNNLENYLTIKDGNTNAIFAPVGDKKFDFIFSNPPFEPTPPGMDYYFNSTAGIYGLNFVEELLKNVNNHLNEGGRFQMVTMAPGDENTPFMLYELIRKYLADSAVEVILDLQPITYSDFVNRFTQIFNENQTKIAQMKEEASLVGVSHLHMLVLKYKKGVIGNIQTVKAHKIYEAWLSPLGAALGPTI